jgi:DNA-directed RNA polymerase specialized sigma24 family protein
MNKSKLLVIGANHPMLKNLAFKLCNGRDIHNDLFQEFLLYLCEKDEAFLLKKYEEIQFISYCSNVIKGLNSNRYTQSKYINSKNPLIEKCNSFEVLDFEISDICYNFEIDAKFDRTVKFIKEYPDQLKADILFKSIELSTREIANDLGLNQRQLIYQNNKLKNEIKKKVK